MATVVEIYDQICHCYVKQTISSPYDMQHNRLTFTFDNHFQNMSPKWKFRHQHMNMNMSPKSKFRHQNMNILNKMQPNGLPWYAINAFLCIYKSILLKNNSFFQDQPMEYHKDQQKSRTYFVKVFCWSNGAFWSSISQICKSNQLYKRIFKSFGLIDFLSLGQINTVVFKSPTTSDFDEEWQF